MAQKGGKSHGLGRRLRNELAQRANNIMAAKEGAQWLRNGKIKLLTIKDEQWSPLSTVCPAPPFGLLSRGAHYTPASLFH
eukprot:829589-Pelagomonas_calceolata.AAC.10